jgi:hypothetical protein
MKPNGCGHDRGEYAARMGRRSARTVQEYIDETPMNPERAARPGVIS